MSGYKLAHLAAATRVSEEDVKRWIKKGIATFPDPRQTRGGAGARPIRGQGRAFGRFDVYRARIAAAISRELCVPIREAFEVSRRVDWITLAAAQQRGARYLKATRRDGEWTVDLVTPDEVAATNLAPAVLLDAAAELADCDRALEQLEPGKAVRR